MPFVSNLIDRFYEFWEDNKESIRPKPIDEKASAREQKANEIRDKALTSQAAISSVRHQYQQQTPTSIDPLIVNEAHLVETSLYRLSEKMRNIADGLGRGDRHEGEMQIMEDHLKRMEALLDTTNIDPTAISTKALEIYQEQYIELMKQDMEFLHSYVRERIGHYSGLHDKGATLGEPTEISRLAYDRLEKTVTHVGVQYYDLIKAVQEVSVEHFSSIKQMIEPLRHQFIGEALDEVDLAIPADNIAGLSGYHVAIQNLKFKLEHLTEELKNRDNKGLNKQLAILLSEFKFIQGTAPSSITEEINEVAELFFEAQRLLSSE